jgi:hypothetical protein
MSPLWRALAALLAGSTMSLGAHAGLSIEGQLLTAGALVTGPDGRTHGTTWFWESTLGRPVQVVSSGIQSQGMAAAARQTPDGFFFDEVRLDKPWGAAGGPYTMTASTRFSITVVTDTPDTPLVLDFHFLGSTLAGGAHYGDGRMTVGNEVVISGHSPGAPGVATWGFQDQLQLDSSTGDSRFTRQSNGTDVQGIGLPQLANDTAGWHEFQSRGSADRLSFVGRLDFGLLQPGQAFRLDYDARSWIEADIAYAGDAHAELVDPFSLGGTPPAQLQLQGLTLPVAVVPEPASAATLAAGLAVLVVAARRRRRGAGTTRIA